MAGRFVLRRSGEQFLFNLRASGNHEVILTSERYTTKESALEGIQAVRVNAAIAERYQLRVSSAGQAYFVLRGSNHEVVGTSEMYSSPAAREVGMAAVRANTPAARIEDQTRAEPRSAKVG